MHVVFNNQKHKIFQEKNRGDDTKEIAVLYQLNKKMIRSLFLRVNTDMIRSLYPFFLSENNGLLAFGKEQPVLISDFKFNNAE